MAPFSRDNLDSPTNSPSIESLFSIADQQRSGTTEESQNNDSSVQEPHNIEAVVYGLKLAEVLGNMRGSFHPQEQRAVSAWIKVYIRLSFIPILIVSLILFGRGTHI